MYCPNCNTRLSCGCQKRTASNGSQVCSLCLNKYEGTLTSPQPTAKKATVKVLYTGPQK